jgi:outer membrane receptor protein involved in Fe transport
MNNMTTRSVLALLSALSLGVGSLRAQSAPADSTAKENPDAQEETIVLDPFTVSTETEGYKAVDTLAGGRIRTNLKDVPSSISVITPKFLQDLAITNAQDLFIYTNNTEIAGLNGNFSGVTTRGEGVAVSSPAEANRLVNPAGVNRARGLTAMDSTRNYFLSDIPWDGYNISRVDISRGPNSFLFGVGSPSGIANVSTNEAVFSDKGKVEARVGSFGSTRESVDVNKVLLPSQLAIRLDLVNDDAQFQQEPAYNHGQRAYGAIRFDPKLLDTGSAHTKIQANFESGKIDSNNPRTIPPLDYVTGYLNDPRASATGYNPWAYKQDGNIGLDPNASWWSSSGSLGNELEFGGAQYYYDAATGKLLKAGNGTVTAPTSTGFGTYSNTWTVHSQGYAGYAGASNYEYLQANNNVDGGDFKGAKNGTVKYLDKTLSDPSIFDFYHKLIDGDNKHEWQRWNAYNISVVQSLFNDRLVIQAVADHEKVNSGSAGLFTTRSPVITLDLDSYSLNAGTATFLGGGVANPNVGRPLVFGSQGSINVDESTRNNYQVTAAYNLDFERDFGMTGSLGKILGHHDFTALGGHYTKSEDHRTYKLNGIDPQFQVVSGNNSNPLPTANGFSWLAYLGDSVLGTTGTGADLSNLSTVLTPPSVYSYSVFSKTWTAGSGVNPTDPWAHPDASGATITQTQADNPANYQGWSPVSLQTISGESLPDVLATGGNKKIQRITSEAIMYQGHFWNDTIVPTFGYRRDKTWQRGNDASQFQDPVTQIYDLNYSVVDQGVKSTTTSTSWGVAVHLPQAIKKNLPEGTDVSVYYFHGANETPKVRYALDGSQLPNEKGRTDDYSVQFDGLQGRLTVRLTYFKTVDKSAQASYGQPLGANGWFIDALPQWALVQSATGFVLADTPDDQLDSLAAKGWPDWLRQGWSKSWLGGWVMDHPTEAAAVKDVFKTKFVDMFPQSYWDAYGYKVNVAAIKAGDWANVVSGSPGYPWYDYIGGSHQIHGEWAIIDQDLESKGYEIEATFRPMKNWDITFNGSKVSATQTGLGEAATRYLNGMADIFLGTAMKHAALWGGYDGIGNTFMQNLWAPYLTQVALTGADQPEMRKYKFNIISNYSFEHGFAKGFNVGGAFRWEDKAILGYGIHEAEVYGQKAWISDVNQPIYGPSLSHFDMWLGYQHKLTSKIDWRIQLNLQNVGEKVHLETIAVEPNGDIAQSRIANGMTYNLTTSFSF